MEEKEGELLASILREGEDNQNILASVDKELEVESPADSLSEKEVEKLELPDVHVLKQNEAWEEMRVKNESLEKRLNNLETPESVEKSEFVKSLVGDNEDVEEKWAKEKESLKEEMKREIIQDQLDAQKKQEEQKEHWIKWTNDRLSEVEKDFNVDLTTMVEIDGKPQNVKRNELSVIMRDYSPTDEQGNLDYRKGMKLLNELNKVKETEKHSSTQVKKNIADATVSKETSVKSNKDYYTSQDLRGKDWRSIVHND